MGADLFAWFHGALYFAGILIGPLLTADCLAKERREGTLHLLLLTPLKGSEVVWAKVIVQVMRGLTILLSATPIMVMLMLLGGVGFAEVLIAAAIDLTGLIIGLSIGLLVSSCCQIWGVAAAVSVGLSGVVGLLGLGGLGHLFLSEVGVFLGVEELLDSWLISSRSGTHLQGVFFAGLNRDGVWNLNPLITGVDALQLWFWLVVMVLLLGLFVGMMMVLLVGFKMTSSVIPVGTDFYERYDKWRTRMGVSRRRRRRFRRSLLRSNPVLFLQRYRPIEKWGSLLWVGVFGIAAWVCSRIELPDPQLRAFVTVGLIYLAVLSFMAAGSFAREKAEGQMELLLVTPLRAWHFISARVQRIWSQMGLAGLVLLAALMLSQTPYEYGGEQRFYMACFTVVAFFCIPFAGLDTAFSCRRFWLGWLATVVAVVFVPGMVMLYSQKANGALLIMALAVQLIVGGLSLFGLELSLRERPLRDRVSRATMSYVLRAKARGQDLWRHRIFRK